MKNARFVHLLWHYERKSYSLNESQIILISQASVVAEGGNWLQYTFEANN